jgi:hypothetical protein
LGRNKFKERANEFVINFMHSHPIYAAVTNVLRLSDVGRELLILKGED